MAKRPSNNSRGNVGDRVSSEALSRGTGGTLQPSNGGSTNELVETLSDLDEHVTDLITGSMDGLISYLNEKYKDYTSRFVVDTITKGSSLRGIELGLYEIIYRLDALVACAYGRTVVMKDPRMLVRKTHQDSIYSKLNGMYAPGISLSSGTQKFFTDLATSMMTSTQNTGAMSVHEIILTAPGVDKDTLNGLLQLLSIDGSGMLNLDKVITGLQKLENVGKLDFSNFIDGINALTTSTMGQPSILYLLDQLNTTVDSVQLNNITSKYNDILKAIGSLSMVIQSINGVSMVNPKVLESLTRFFKEYNTLQKNLKGIKSVPDIKNVVDGIGNFITQFNALDKVLKGMSKSIDVTKLNDIASFVNAYLGIAKTTGTSSVIIDKRVIDGIEYLLNAFRPNGQILNALKNLKGIKVDGLDTITTILSSYATLNKINVGKKDKDKLQGIIDTFSSLSDISSAKIDFSNMEVKGIDTIETIVSAYDKLNGITINTNNDNDNDNGQKLKIILDTFSSLSRISSAKIDFSNMEVSGVEVLGKVIKDLNSTLDGIETDNLQSLQLLNSISEFVKSLESLTKMFNKDSEKVYTALYAFVDLFKEDTNDNEKNGLFIKLINNISGVYKAMEGANLTKWPANKELTNPLYHINQLAIGLNSLTSVKLLHALKYYMGLTTVSMNMVYLLAVIKYVQQVSEALGTQGVILGHFDRINTLIDGFNNMHLVSENATKDITDMLNRLMGISIHAAQLGKSVPNALKGFMSVNEELDALKDLINNLSLVAIMDVGQVRKLRVIQSFFDALYDISDNASKLVALSGSASKGFASVEKLLKDIEGVVTVVNSGGIGNINTTVIKKLNDVKDLIGALMGISKAAALNALVGPFGLLGLWLMSKEVNVLNVIVVAVSKILPVNPLSVKNILSLGKLLGIMGGVMLIGALLGGYVSNHLSDLIVFTTSFTIFTLAVLGATLLIAKGLTFEIKSVSELCILVGVCAVTMLIGGGIMSTNPRLVWGALEFAVALAVFIGLIMLAITLVNLIPGGINLSIIGAMGLMKLIAISAGVLILGGLFMMIPGLSEHAIEFAWLLFKFVAGIAVVYGFASLLVRKAAAPAAQLAILVGVSAACLLIGAMFMYIPGMAGNAIAFGFILAGFVGVVCVVYALASLITTEALHVSREFSILVGISAACLLIGGLFMLIPGMVGGTIKFGVILALFVGIVCVTYALSSKWIQKGVSIAWQFGILIGISAACLLIGGGLMLAFPGLFTMTMGFILCVVTYFGAMGTILYFLTKLMDPATLLAGELALAGLCVIGLGMAGVMTIFANVVNKLGGEDGISRLLKVVGIAGLVIVGLGAIAIGLGFLQMAGAGMAGAAFWLGVAGLGAIVTIALGTATCMKVISEAMMNFASLKKIDTSVIGNNIMGFLEVAGLLLPLANPLTLGAVSLACGTVVQISNAVSKIAEAVEEYANLKVPIYEGTKKVGYRALTDDDFVSAAGNIQTIVSTVGGAILELYDRKPELFTTGSMVGDFLKMDTPFSRVVKSCANMGDMISTIAEGVKDYAELKVPVYNGLNKVGYRTLTYDDFENAAKNISEIITTLGGAIITTYYGNDGQNKELFDPGWFSKDTPFTRVVKSCANMGDMISTIAAAVKDYASLRVPVYTGTEVTGYRVLTPMDFTNAATNIQKIITTIGTTIVTMATMYPNLFDSSKNGVFVTVVESCASMGNMIGSISEGIKSYAELRMPVYDENGEVTGYREMTESDFTNAGDNIKKILTTIAGSIVETYNTYPNMFYNKYNPNANSIFGIVVKSQEGLGELINKEVEAIKMIADMDLSKLGSVENGSGALGAIKKIITGIPGAIIAVYKGNEDMFKDASVASFFSGNDASRTTFAVVCKATQNSVGIVKGVLSAYTEVVKLVDEAKKSGKTIDQLSEDLQKLIKAVPTAIVNVIRTDDGTDSYLKEYLENTSLFDTIKETYKRLTDIIKTVSGTYGTVNEMIGKVIGNELSVDDIGTRIKEMVLCVPEAIYSAISSETYGTLFTSEEDAERIRVIMEKYAAGITQFVTLYNKLPEDVHKSKPFTSYMDDIYTRVSGVKDTEVSNFAYEVEQLDKYVKTINAIDTSKVTSFTSMTDSINRLASNMGSMDKLTEVLATKITTVLTKLNTELKASATMIRMSDEMQKRREKSIKDSIKTIKDIMSQDLKVKVSTESVDEDNVSVGDASGGGTGSLGGTLTPTSDTKTGSDNVDTKKGDKKESISTDTPTTKQQQKSTGGTTTSGASFPNATFTHATINRLTGAGTPLKTNNNMKQTSLLTGSGTSLRGSGSGTGSLNNTNNDALISGLEQIITILHNYTGC